MTLRREGGGGGGGGVGGTDGIENAWTSLGMDNKLETSTSLLLKKGKGFLKLSYKRVAISKRTSLPAAETILSNKHYPFTGLLCDVTSKTLF